MKWTALIGVTPGRIGSSVKVVAGALSTVTRNASVAVVFEPPISVAATVTVAVPAATALTVTVLPETVTDATAGADVVAS